MRRLIVHFAIALATCFVGVTLSGGRKAAPAPHVAPVAARTYYTAAPSPRQHDEEEIREIIRQYDIAQTRHDESFFRRVETDDFALTLSDGRTLTRAQAIADMLTWPKDDEYTSEVSGIHFHGGVAVVTGTMTVKRAGEEGGYEGKWVDVFVRRDGRWQIQSTVQAD